MQQSKCLKQLVQTTVWFLPNVTSCSRTRCQRPNQTVFFSERESIWHGQSPPVCDVWNSRQWTLHTALFQFQIYDSCLSCSGESDISYHTNETDGSESTIPCLALSSSVVLMQARSETLCKQLVISCPDRGHSSGSIGNTTYYNADQRLHLNNEHIVELSRFWHLLLYRMVLAHGLPTLIPRSHCSASSSVLPTAYYLDHVCSANQKL